MSHYKVIVIGADPESQLAPYHEFECTGRDDQYVQDIDVTEDRRKEYESATKRLVHLPDGRVISRYDNECYREPTPEEISKHGPAGLMGSGCGGGIMWSSNDWGDGKGYRPKIHSIPDGAKEVEQPCKEVQTFDQWLLKDTDKAPVPYGAKPDLAQKHKYGYVQLDDDGNVSKVIDRTNPNKKWDWYQEGGRYSGILTKQGEIATSLTRGEVDLGSIQFRASKEALDRWEIANAITQGTPEARPWDEIFEQSKDRDEAVATYRSQPRVVVWNEAMKLESNREKFGFFSNCEELQVSREDYVKQAIETAFSSFAVIKDGKWHERGEMGWWGCVSNEQDKMEWQRQFNELILNLPDDELITVIDCHI